MFKLILILFFKLINTNYEDLDISSLSKLINNEDLKKELIAKKKFFNLWRIKTNTIVYNEKTKIRKIKVHKKENLSIVNIKTTHSFHIKSNKNRKKSSEILNYIILMSNFKIIDMACLEYDSDKYKKLLYGNFSSSNKIQWQNMLDSIEDIYSKFQNNKNLISINNAYRSKGIYSSEKSSRYAKRYALNYNKHYKDFNNSGGDCTNFVSQCLYAGNIPQKQFWRPYTAPWIRVNELNSYLTRNNIAKEVTSLDELAVGDIIQFFSNSKGFFAHSGIISEILDNGEILYCCHSYDKKDFPLSEIYPILYTKLRLLKIIY